MIAALNRLVMIGEFRPLPHLHTPRLGALTTIARAARRLADLNPVLWDLMRTLTPSKSWFESADRMM
jgi:hypothetical protein